MGLAAGVITGVIGRGEQLLACPAGSVRSAAARSGRSELLSRVSSGVGFSELETEELPLLSSSSSSPLPPS